jgi:hypothetical protein
MPEGEGDHSHGTRQAAEKRQAFAAARARKSEGLAKLKAHFQEIINVIEVENREHELQRLIQDGEQRLHDWRIHLPPVPARTVTARARRPHQEERAKGPRHGPKYRKNFATKAAIECAHPSSMKRARKGSSHRPIHITSSSEGGKQSSDDLESEDASSASSNVALEGFHYSSGYSSDDSYPSSEM